MEPGLIPSNILLISENKLKNFTDIDSNVTTQVLLPFISYVQQAKLEYIIGGPYYQQLVLEVSGQTLTTTNRQFLEYFAQPLLVWSAYAECLSSIWGRIKNNGIVNGSEQTITMKEMEFFQRRADDRSQFFEQRLIDEIIYNSGKYPLVFSWNSNSGLQPHLGKQYFSGIYIPNGKGPFNDGRLYSGQLVYADPTFWCCGFDF
jgi:hypothetical protein